MTTEVSTPHPPLGVAFIGGGFMGEVHARAARAAGGDLVGVASRSVPSSERARRRLGLKTAYGSVDELLEDDRVDVVHICSPNATHFEFAKAALTAGKNVVCEKPLATSVQAAEELLRAAAAAVTVTAVPFVYRFHPMVREARERLTGGVSGRVFSIQGSYLQDWLNEVTDDDWRVGVADGGPSRAFADIGSHLSDLVEFVTGDRIHRLVSRHRTVYPDRVANVGISTEDVVTVVFETLAGAIGTLHVSQVSAGHKNRLTIEVDAERESLLFDQETPELLCIGTKAGFLQSMRSQALSPAAARYSTLPAGHPQGYQDAFNAFVADVYAAIATGVTPSGLPGFEDGVRAALVTHAVLESHRTGGWVEVGDVDVLHASLIADPHHRRRKQR